MLENIDDIKPFVFYNCKSLTNVDILSNIYSIGESAFYGNTSLMNLRLGKDVSLIANSAFSGNKNIRTITVLNPTPPTCKDGVFDGVKTEAATLYVPQESVSLYQTADTWMDFWNIMEKDMSGVESTLADDANISVENGNIVVTGATQVEVYSTNGQCIYSGAATTIPVSTNGLYIVKANGKSFKVIL